MMEIPHIEFTYPKSQKERTPYPRYLCFCCHDRGVVHQRWVDLVAQRQGTPPPDYPQLCQASRCQGRYFHGTWQKLGPGLLRDFSTEVCDQFHRMGQEEWQEECRTFVEQTLAPVTEKPSELTPEKIDVALKVGKPATPTPEQVNAALREITAAL